jgi:hypothetical protein
MAADHEHVEFPSLKELSLNLEKFDGRSDKYIEWRNSLENIFEIMGIAETLTVFGRYSGNPKIGYTRELPNLTGDGSDNDHRVALFNIEYFRKVKAKILTKLTSRAKRIYELNPNINCYYKIRANDNTGLLDATNYPITVATDYTQNNWHITARGRGGLAHDSPQVSFREVFDRAFLTKDIRLGYQTKFQNMRFIPDYSDVNSFRDFEQKYESAKILANYEFGPTFANGELEHLLGKIPPEYKHLILLAENEPQNRREFFEKCERIFQSNKLATTEKKEYKTHKVNKIHNIKTTNYTTNTQTKDKSQVQCYNCKKYGHYARECRSAKEESFNNIRGKPKYSKPYRPPRTPKPFRWNVKFKGSRNTFKRPCNKCGFTPPKHKRTCPHRNAEYYNGKKSNKMQIDRKPKRYHNYKESKEEKPKKEFNKKKINHYKEESEHSESEQDDTKVIAESSKTGSRKYLF